MNSLEYIDRDLAAQISQAGICQPDDIFDLQSRRDALLGLEGMTVQKLEWLLGRITELWAAFNAADDSELRYYRAKTRYGAALITAYAGDTWEQGGFTVDATGNPIEDHRGNAVIEHSVEPLDPCNGPHCMAVENWFGMVFTG